MASAPTPARPASQAPHTRPVAEALDASEPLGRLVERLRESQARFEVLRAVLAPALLAHVRPGVLDDTGWSLMAANGAVAAKLRQCLPSIEQALADRGWQGTAIRVKVQSSGI